MKILMASLISFSLALAPQAQAHTNTQAIPSSSSLVSIETARELVRSGFVSAEHVQWVSSEAEFNQYLSQQHSGRPIQTAMAMEWLICLGLVCLLAGSGRQGLDYPGDITVVPPRPKKRE